MKLLYLGTAAAEGIPGTFCSCAVCQEAIEKKGRHIRTRSQALVDGKIVIDYPPDSYSHYIRSGFTAPNLPVMRHLFVTHSHMDHFYPDDLHDRRPGMVASKPVETLHIYGNRAVERKLLDLQESTKTMPSNEFHYAKPFEPIEAEGYRVTPLPARHNPNEECLFYTVEHGGKALLYGQDTGIFPEPVWEYFASAKPRFNLVSLDCTTMARKDTGGRHMGIPDCLEVREKLFAMGAADAKTVFILNHFSHNGRLLYDELQKAAEAEGFTAAYDGLEVEVP